MSDAHHKAPNAQLRREREIHGWTQNYVATHIDTNPYTISRWENGITFPSSKYRLKLCELFEKSPAELGLLPLSKERPQDAVTPDENVVSTTLYDPAIPHIPHALFGRNEMLVTLKQLLLDKQQTTALAIKGLPGAGKTALAIVLAHDAGVRAQFSDGILWATLGPHPDVRELLGRWGKLLGFSSTYLQELATVDTLKKAIIGAIGTKHILIVIDDAWTVEDTFIFQVGNPYCAHLITTQQARVALDCADHSVITNELSTQEGIALLLQLASLSESKTNDVHPLVSSVGGLPLALTLMGRYIYAETFSNHKRRLSNALERLHSAKERLSLTQPLDPTEGISSLVGSTTFSLQSIFSVSDEHLSPEARSALRVLAVFPPKPSTFREEDALAIVTPKALDELTDASLIESLGQDGYTMHPVVADYAKTD